MRDYQSPEWDLDVEYPGLQSAELQADRQNLKDLIAELSQLAAGLKGDHVLDHAKKMAILQKEAEILLYNLNSYAYLKRATDLKNHQAREALDGFKKLGIQLDQVRQPLEQFVLRTPEHVFEDFLQTPELQDSNFYYRHLRRNHQRLLPLAQENLLSGLELDGFQAWSNLYTNLTGSVDYTLENDEGESESVGVARLISLLGDRSEPMRKRAHMGLQEVFTTHQESCAAILNAMAGWRLELCQRRSHTVPTHFLDEPLHQNRMQRSSLDAMIQAVYGQRELGHRAFQLMAQTLGKAQVDPWDAQAPAPELDGKGLCLNFPEALDLIVAAFSEVDESMGQFARTMQERRWIDAAAQAYKAPGAFCSGFAKSRTPRVLLTYLGSTSNLITLAHELGHAFHSWVMREMPYRETRYPMGLAETASTFAETVVRHYLLRQAQTPAAKLAILWEEVSSIPRFGLNIPVRYEFEKAFYEARAERQLTPDDFRALMRQTWNHWYGESMSAADEMFWAWKLHFYISAPSFYNFPYTFGYFFSQRIYAERERRGSDFFTFYTDLLKDTGRMQVEELVQKHFEADLTRPDFWQASFEIAQGYLQTFEALLPQV